MITQLKALSRSRNAVLLLAASATSRFGDWFYITALSAVVTKAGGVEALAFITAFRQACLVFLLPVGGAIVDHLPKRKTMVATDLVRFALMAGLALAVSMSNPSVPIIATLSCMAAFASIFFGPARRALLPMSVEDDQRNALNALDGTIATTTLALAPAIGGALLSFLDYWVIFALNAITFVGSAAFLAGLRGRQVSPPAKSPVDRSIGDWFAATARGFAPIVRTPMVLTMTLLGVASHAGVGATWIFIPILSRRLGIGDPGIGYLTAAVGAGSVAGMIVGGYLRKEYHLLGAFVGVAMFGLTLATWDLATIHMFAPFLVAVGMGVFANLFEAPCWSILQTSTAPENYGRVFSAFDALTLVGMTIGTTIAAVAVEHCTFGEAVMTIAGFMLLVTILAGVVALRARKVVAGLPVSIPAQEDRKVL
jgi:MFS family permease